MALDIKLLDIIACPVCKGKLHYQPQSDKAAHELICRFDRLAYPLEEDPRPLGEPGAPSAPGRAEAMSFVVVIPARYASTRLPGKPLADIHGKPMVQHVVEKALQSGADRVIVAIDDERVRSALAPFAEQAGVEVCMTSKDHQSGTERLAEVCRHYGFAADTIVVNVQGDEPLIPPAIIRQVADNLAAATAPMATLSVPIQDAEEAFNPNAVKVVTDKDGYALYFSRASIPGTGIASPRVGSRLAVTISATSVSTPIAPASSSVTWTGRRARSSR